MVPGTRKGKTGDIIQLCVSGLASTPSSAITSTIPVAGITVAIGTANALVSFAGLVAPGQFQVNFTVPQLTPGEYNITISVSVKTSPSGILFEVGQ